VPADLPDAPTFARPPCLSCHFYRQGAFLFAAALTPAATQAWLFPSPNSGRGVPVVTDPPRLRAKHLSLVGQAPLSQNWERGKATLAWLRGGEGGGEQECAARAPKPALVNVSQVAIRPTEASDAAGRPALTPELLAATGARYSRSNDGLGAILAKVDPANPDASVEAIFRFVDYGHASIGDLVPVALFLDGVSLFLAYYVWTLCPAAGGQESSTRYIRLTEKGLADPEILGIPADLRDEWRARMERSFAAYQDALGLWENIAARDPDAARIPRALQQDTSPKAVRQVARMRRNFGFDRARYFLPVAAKTNVMLLQSARAWVTLCQHLLSHPLAEARLLGDKITTELRLAAPRMLKHAARKEGIAAGIADEFEAARREALQTPLDAEAAPTPYLDVLAPRNVPAPGAAFANDLRRHDNRYGHVGPDLRRTAVRFGWDAVAFAEIRDLNRHRTGTRFCPLVPVGFYAAQDQLPPEAGGRIADLAANVGGAANARARALLENGDPAYVYFTLLGTQFPFERVTTADKFLYEAELRTGTGAHYRYARHYRDALALWYDRFPETRGRVLEGSAEPE